MIKAKFIELNKESENDLEEIWFYSFTNFGKRQANLYQDELTNVINSLLKNPHIGVSCDYIKNGYRKYNINKHLVIYRLTKDSIYIVRVLSNKMDYSNHL